MQFTHSLDLQITSSSEGISRAESTGQLRMSQRLAFGGPTIHFWSVSTHGERFRFSKHLRRDRHLLMTRPVAVEPAY
jgi:hypothetical protein